MGPVPPAPRPGPSAEDRPRERLARHGAPALSNRELLALLLGTRLARGPPPSMSRSGLLGAGLRGLAGAVAGRARGGARPRPRQGGARAGGARAGRAPGLGRPGAGAGLPDARRSRRAYLLPRYGARPVETFGLLALDVRHRLKREAVISVGCLTSSLVHPREVFQEAVVARAAALVLFHNHPSGDPEPSAEDVALTRRLASAGTLMGIEILDHLVLGAGRFVSLKERGVL